MPAKWLEVQFVLVGASEGRFATRMAEDVALAMEGKVNDGNMTPLAKTTIAGGQ